MTKICIVELEGVNEVLKSLVRIWTTNSLKKNEMMLNLSRLCQSDKSMTSFAPSLKIQVYDDHIV